jgi:hypothetical protein
MRKLLGMMMVLFVLASCSENYSNGERIGLITQFSRTGVIFKTHEGHLNLTQTGMNSSSSEPFNFSIDRDSEDRRIIDTIEKAALYGWKVKLVYHETFGYNWFKNRGMTDHFITNVEVIDRNMVSNTMNKQSKSSNSSSTIHDTIYVVIDNRKK